MALADLPNLPAADFDPDDKVVIVDISAQALKLAPASTVKGGKGDKGETGNAGTITIGAVVTLEPGESATVVNVGSPTAAVLDIGIPRGEDGEDGAGGSGGFPTTVCTVSFNGSRDISTGTWSGTQNNPFILPTEDEDAGNNYNPATGLYTVPSNGTYRVSGSMRWGDDQTVGSGVGMAIGVNGADSDFPSWSTIVAATYFRRTYVGYVPRRMVLTAGQQIRMSVFADPGAQNIIQASMTIERVL